MLATIVIMIAAMCTLSYASSCRCVNKSELCIADTDLCCNNMTCVPIYGRIGVCGGMTTNMCQNCYLMDYLAAKCKNTCDGNGDKYP